MSYVDGFILPLRDERLDEYRKLAEKFAGKARSHGALGSLEAIMADPEMQPGMQEMPFDGKRMFWGGFKPFVSTWGR